MAVRTLVFTIQWSCGRKNPAPFIICVDFLPGIHQVQREVHPSPSKTRMDQAKGTVTELTYPHIFFPVDDFDDFFSAVVCKVCREVLVLMLSCTFISFASSPRGESHSALWLWHIAFCHILLSFSCMCMYELVHRVRCDGMWLR